jgi:hypothetical protein
MNRHHTTFEEFWHYDGNLLSLAGPLRHLNPVMVII